MIQDFREKCEVTPLSVQYLGHLLYQEGIVKGIKSDAVQTMPVPMGYFNIIFFSWIYTVLQRALALALPTIMETLHRLTRKKVQ